jgi:hypothetical protein
MKIYKISLKFIVFSMIVTSFVSCVNDDTNVTPSNEKPILNVTQTEFTVKRGETIEIPITISRAINDVIPVEIRTIEGDALPNIDFEAGDGNLPGDFGNPETSFISDIPATLTSFGIPLTALSPIVGGGNRTVELQLNSTGIKTGIFEGGAQSIFVTIEPSDNLVVNLAWDAEYLGEDGETYSFCDWDLDLEVYDSADAIVANSYSDCPEQLTIESGGLPDGDYTIVPSYWAPASPAPVNFESIPALMTISKPGSFVQEFDLSGIWTDFEDGASTGNPNGYQFEIANLNIQGTTYTITDPVTGEVIVEGRTAE